MLRIDAREFVGIAGGKAPLSTAPVARSIRSRISAAIPSADQSERQ
jgi:hypothetical protein